MISSRPILQGAKKPFLATHISAPKKRLPHCAPGPGPWQASWAIAYEKIADSQDIRHGTLTASRLATNQLHRNPEPDVARRPIGPLWDFRAAMAGVTVAEISQRETSPAAESLRRATETF